MAKSLCKYRRVEIADQFAKISRLVSEPRFVCSSCARAASDRAYLCKPSALTMCPEAKASPLAGKVPAKGSLPAERVSALQPDLAVQIGLGDEDTAAPQVPLKKEQAKKLKKLAKKKNKRLKKADKAVQRYEKALAKAQKCQ